jgi:hypothetical protein
MAFVINQKDGMNIPALNCDVCKQPIAEPGNGLAVFRPEGGGCKFVHKGECDRAQQLLSNCHLHWMSLGQYLAILNNNLKVDVKKELKENDKWNAVFADVARG